VLTTVIIPNRQQRRQSNQNTNSNPYCPFAQTFSRFSGETIRPSPSFPIARTFFKEFARNRALAKDSSGRLAPNLNYRIAEQLNLGGLAMYE
jgi:hypothetical protein